MGSAGQVDTTQNGDLHEDIQKELRNGIIKLLLALTLWVVAA